MKLALGIVTVIGFLSSVNLANAQASARIPIRDPLTSDRTYYVRTDGNDANMGLIDDASGAFRTIQRAVDVVGDDLDLGGYTVTIKVADGSYTETTTIDGTFVGRGAVAIVGNNSTPSNVTITTAGHCFYVRGCWTPVTISGVKMSVTTGNCIYVEGGDIRVQSVDFGAATTSYSIHAMAVGPSFIRFTGPYTVSGGAQAHWAAQNGGTIIASGFTVTLTGTPNFTTGFAYILNGSSATIVGMGFSGSASGKRYHVISNGTVQTGGHAEPYLPGNSAGTTNSGGQYGAL